MGKIGIEPTMFTTRERIYSPPQHHQSLPLSQNPEPRVSNVFIVLCFPLGCFMLCQPHRVVSDIIMPFDFMFLENSLSSTCTYDGLLKLRNIRQTGNQIKCKPTPLHIFIHSDSHTLIRQFFLPIKRIDSIRKKWKF